MRIGAGTTFQQERVSTQVDKQAAAPVASFVSVFAAAKAESKAGAAASSPASIDFTRMTPNRMQEVARQLYEAGEIDADQFWSLTLTPGRLAKVGLNGEAIPFTAQEQATIMNTPVDYVQHARNVIASIENRGAMFDPTAGYEKWKHILHVMQTHASSVGQVGANT